MNIVAPFAALVLAGGFAFANAAAPAAPVVPATPAGRALSAWLAAFDSGDRQKMLRFLQTYDPAKVNGLDGQMEFQHMTGGFDVRKILSATPTSIAALLQERLSDSFARVQVTVGSLPPHHVTMFGLNPAQRPAEFALPHLSQAQLLAQLQERLQRETAMGRFAGAALVAKDGNPIFRQAYGLADRARDIPNTVDTRFRIGSMNKMFTATSVMQLVQAGKIDLDKPFGTYLTDYPNKTVASAVTIRQLLTHTGGTGDIFGPDFEKNRFKLRTLQDYITVYGNRSLRFKPGTKWEYSNYGFILLGAVIEKVSGENYYDYVREHVYAPAGMTSTGSEPEDASVPQRSTGYTQMMGSAWQPNTGMLPYRGTSAGGGYSTVGDLLRFADALQNHTLLNAEYTRMMMTGKVVTPDGGRYGFGFGDRVVNGTRCFGHNGGAPGMNGDLEICPGSGYVIAVLSNLDPPAASRIADFAANRLPPR